LFESGSPFLLHCGYAVICILTTSTFPSGKVCDYPGLDPLNKRHKLNSFFCAMQNGPLWMTLIDAQPEERGECFKRVNILLIASKWVKMKRILSCLAKTEK
jgi:hypothetical protein